MDVHAQKESCVQSGVEETQDRDCTDLKIQTCQNFVNVQVGSAEKGTPESENEIERPKVSEIMNSNLDCEPPIPDNYKLDSEKMVTDSVELKDIKLPLVQERSMKIESERPDFGANTKNHTVDGSGQLWEVEIYSNFENSVEPLKNVPVNIENTCVPPVRASTRIRRAKPSSDEVTSTEALPPKPQEIEASKPEGIEGSGNGEKKRRGRKRKDMQESIVNDFSRTRTHLRYLLHRIKYEQTLIDAYSAEGWKGQSVEKIKPEKELQRAKHNIVRYKLKIRELFQRIDQSLAVGKLPESLFDAEGKIGSEDIFCAKCGSKDLPVDNDIILCDGACQRGFHQFCLEPPLLKEDIPPGEESWLCPGCDCKLDSIDMLKYYHGTNLSLFDSYEKIFPEAALGTGPDDGSISSSEDAEDDDHAPEKKDKVEKILGAEGSDYVADNEKRVGLPEEDSEDDDFDPSDSDQDEMVKMDSSSDFTSESEDLDGLIDDANVRGEDPGENLQSLDHNIPYSGSNEGKSDECVMKRQPLNDEVSYLLEGSEELVSGKRHVARLDYKKLHEETYGNFGESSDEDFDDPTASKRRKRARIGKSPVDVDSGGPSNKRSSLKRLGEDVKQRFFDSFKENQYPERDVKEKLARESGLTVKQVARWFDNTRWKFHHKSQAEPYNTTEIASRNGEWQEPNATTDQENRGTLNLDNRTG